MRVPGIPYVQGRNSYSDTDGKHYGIAIHNTSNNATAAGEASYAARREDGTSSHFYCDNNQVIQSLDLSKRAGHAGSTEGNQNAIAVEITGTNDKSRAWWLTNVDWDELGRVLAWVIKNAEGMDGFQVRRAKPAEMKTNPKVRAFYAHDDMRAAWGGTTHTDPGPNFPWDRLFDAVNAAFTGQPSEAPDMDSTQDKRLTATTERVDALVNLEDQIEPTWSSDPAAAKYPNALAAAIKRIDANAAAAKKAAEEAKAAALEAKTAAADASHATVDPAALQAAVQAAVASTLEALASAAK